MGGRSTLLVEAEETSDPHYAAESLRLAVKDAADEHPVDSDIGMDDASSATVGGSAAVPEVGRADLESGSAHRLIESAGVLVARSIASAQLSTELSILCVRACAARDVWMTEQALIDRRAFDPLPDERRMSFRLQLTRQVAMNCEAVLLVESPVLLTRVLAWLHAEGILEFMADYLGEQPLLTMDKSLCRHIPLSLAHEDLLPPAVYPGWHQDGSGWRSRCRALNLWMPFDECGGASGARGLEMVPCHLEGPLRAADDGVLLAPDDPDLFQDLAAARPVVNPRLGPGDGLLFEKYLLHRSAPRANYDRTRSSVELWFFAPSTVPDGLCPMAVTCVESDSHPT